MSSNNLLNPCDEINQFNITRDLAIVPITSAIASAALVYLGRAFIALGSSALIVGGALGALQALAARAIMQLWQPTDYVLPKMFAAHLVSGTTLYAIAYLAFKVGLIASCLTISGAALVILATAALSIGATLLLSKAAPPLTVEEAIKKANDLYKDASKASFIKAHDTLIEAWRNHNSPDGLPPKDLALELAHARCLYAVSYHTDTAEQQIYLSSLSLQLYAIGADPGSMGVGYILKNYHDLEKLENDIENNNQKPWISMDTTILSMDPENINSLIEKAQLTPDQRCTFAQNLTRISCKYWDPDGKQPKHAKDLFESLLLTAKAIFNTLDLDNKYYCSEYNFLLMRLFKLYDWLKDESSVREVLLEQERIKEGGSLNFLAFIPEEEKVYWYRKALDAFQQNIKGPDQEYRIAFISIRLAEELLKTKPTDMAEVDALKKTACDYYHKYLPVHQTEFCMLINALCH